MQKDMTERGRKKGEKEKAEPHGVGFGVGMG